MDRLMNKPTENRLTEYVYKLDITKAQMKKFGFTYDYEVDDYTYTFPVHKYNNKIPTIFCKIGIDDDTKLIWIKVCDKNNTLYCPYYSDEYGKNSIIQDIEKAISNELSKLGVVRVI